MFGAETESAVGTGRRGQGSCQELAAGERRAHPSRAARWLATRSARTYLEAHKYVVLYVWRWYGVRSVMGTTVTRCASRV